LHQIVHGHGSGPISVQLIGRRLPGAIRARRLAIAVYRNVRLVEATVAGLGFYLFTVHTVTTDERSETTRDDYPPRLVVKSA
jgi:hypothetical protein